MRFLAELSGNRFKYGDFISKNGDYDLVFANYDTEYITRMGGSYELNSVIPAHGNKFAITSAKYTEPFSDEFEIVNLNGVIPENKVGEICEKLFMNGTSYKKLRYWNISQPSIKYLNCIFTNPEAIEGGVNGQWGTIGFKFTLTADSQFCWEDKNGFTIRSNSSHTFYSGDAATIIPPKITITLNGVSTLYNNNKNSISFEINNVPINIDIPDNGTDDNNIYKDHSIVVANAPLKFIIDPKLRQVYGEYIDSGKVKIILGYPENRTDQKTTYISLASVFTGFKTIPKGWVTIDDLSGNIQSIQFGDYNVGYLI